MGYTSNAGYGGAPVRGVLSPFADASHLAPGIAWTEWLSADEAANIPLTRATALQVPAVHKVYSLLVSTIAPLPLVVRTKDGPLETQPTWTSRTDVISSTPYLRMANIVGDILFSGYSVLAVKRGAKDQVLQLAHIPLERIGSDAQGRLTIDRKTVDESEVCIIQTPYDGLLNVGARTIRFGADLEKARADRAANPIPLLIFSHHNTDTQGSELEEDERKALLEAYKRNQRAGGSSAAYLPPGIRAEALGVGPTDHFEAAINANTTAIGQLTNVRASMLDGTLADSSSETYKNAQGERSAYLTFDVPFFTRAIEDRLSQNDIVPGPQSVAFDFTEFYNAPSPTGAQRDD